MLAPTKKLLRHMTADYDAGAHVHGYGTIWYYEYRRKPPFRRLFHVPAMLANWRIQLVLQIFQGAITSLTHFWIDEEDEEVKKYIIKQIEQWWRTSASKMLWGAMPFGYYGAEILYRYDEEGRIAFKDLKSLAAQDIHPVTHKGEVVGIQIRNFRGSKVRYIGGEKAFWHVHWREWHPVWGQSRLFGAYDPWIELVSEGGGLDVRRLYFYRNVLQRDTIYHPNEMIQDEGGNLIWSGHVARSLLEKHRSGGVLSLPSVTWDAMGTGQKKWELETHDMSGGGDMVIQQVDKYADEICEGMGMSPEIIRAAESGSGYSGRKIPEAAWRGLLSGIVLAMVQDFDCGCLRAMVRHISNREPSYQIVPFGLAKDETDDSVQGEMLDQREPEQNPPKAKGVSAGGGKVPQKAVQMATEGALAV